MPFDARTYRVLIASPSDLQEEREIATHAIHDWNDQHAAAEAVVLLPEKYETHAIPQTGVRPQQAINDQLVNRCDLLIGMFWTKYGSDTGVADSGTVEEINEAVSAGKPVMLYFSARAVDPTKIDIDQHQKLTRFKEETYKNALVGKFRDPSELRQILLRDLVHLVRSIKSKENTAPTVERDGEQLRLEHVNFINKLVGPKLPRFPGPKLIFELGMTVPNPGLCSREDLFRFVKRSVLQNHLLDEDARLDPGSRKGSLFASPEVLRHAAAISCFEEASRVDPFSPRDIRLLTTKFIVFDSSGFIDAHIGFPERKYATRFGPGGGAADPVDSYCFWHVVFYLQYLLWWAYEFYSHFSADAMLGLKVSLQQLDGELLKLEYGVCSPSQGAVSAVEARELQCGSRDILDYSRELVTSICGELLWGLGEEEPPPKEEVAQLVRMLWNGRDC